MKFLKKNILFLLLMAFLAVISGCNDDDDDNNSSNGSTMSMTIMHMNDSHSYAEGASGEKLSIDGTSTYFDMGGYARLTTKVADIRAEADNSLLLHAGDAVQGTLYFTRYEGEADFEFLNAMCVGNHEFDKGPEYLANFIDYADFPIISANVDASAEASLVGLVEPYVIKEYDGEKVGIIGLTTPTTEYTSNPGDDVFFNDLNSTVASYVSELENQGINKIILLTHLGYDEDVALAGSVEGVDIIVGGHSHTMLGGEDLEALGKSPAGAYPTVVENPEGESTYVVQAWQHTLALGRLDVEFDEDGIVTSISGTPVLLLGDDSIKQKNEDGDKVEVDEETRAAIVSVVAENSAVEFVTEDAGAVEMLAPYKAGIEDMETEVIATVSSDLYHTRIPFTDKYGEGVPLPYGSYIAPLVCDGMIWKMEQVGTDVDFALQNAGGVRKTINEGDLTVGDVYELMPFGNTLVVLELTGADFKAAIQSGVDAAASGSSTGAYPYVGGCRYTVDAQTTPESPVVTSVEKQDDSGNWTAIDDDVNYMMVTNAYIAGGGDYYSVLEEADGYRYDTGFVDAEVFMDYAITMEELDRPDSTGVTYLTDAVVLKLIETTDVHGSLFPYDFVEAEDIFNSLTQINTYVESERDKTSQSVVLLDDGDILQGQPVTNYYNYERDTLEGHVVADIMNYMAYDAATVGNHDIEPGKDVYDAVESQFAFPWLAANCVSTITGEPYFEPYTIIEENGVKIAVLGLVTPGIPSWLPETVWPDMEFRDMIETAAEWVPVIQAAENPDLIVGLFHAGTDYTYGGVDADTYKNQNASQLVAEQVPGFDIIFVGHDHMNHAYTVECENTGDSVMILGADNAAVAFSEATVVMTPNGDGTFTKEIDGIYKDATEYDIDEDMYSYFGYAVDATRDYVDEEIGTFTEATSSRDAMFGDSSFNDLVHELQFSVSENVIGQKPDVSFAAPLQFDKTIEAGPVYVRDMYKLYKYENTLYLMSLTGAEIDGHLEYSYASWTNQMSSAEDHLLNFDEYDEATGNYDLAARYYNYDSAAGIVYEVDVTMPENDRVTILGMDADLDGVVDEGAEFDEDATYTCAINSYRAGGGGGHLTNGAGISEDALSDRQIDVTARDLRYYLIEDIKDQGTVTPQEIGNWEFIPEDWAAAGAARDEEILYGSGDGDH